MMKKVVLGLIICSFLAASAFSVKAADSITTTDNEEDVVNEYGAVVPRDNIDIASVSCEKTGGAVDLQLTLVDGGEIQNSEFIIYQIYLITSENEYDATYYYGEVIVYDQYYTELEGAEYSGEGTRTLTISFDLVDSDEDPMQISGTTMEISEDGESYFADSTEIGEPTLTVDAGESYEGEVGESISFSATVEDGTSPYEWQWDFGDGEYSFEQNPSHAYEEEGTYEAYVLVMDSNDNYGMAEVTVVISASSGGTVSSDSESGITMFVALITTIIIIGIAVLIYITRR